MTMELSKLSLKGYKVSTKNNKLIVVKLRISINQKIPLEK